MTEHQFTPGTLETFASAVALLRSALDGDREAVNTVVSTTEDTEGLLAAMSVIAYELGVAAHGDTEGFSRFLIGKQNDVIARMAE